MLFQLQLQFRVVNDDCLIFFMFDLFLVCHPNNVCDFNLFLLFLEELGSVRFMGIPNLQFWTGPRDHLAGRGWLSLPHFKVDAGL